MAKKEAVFEVRPFTPRDTDFAVEHADLTAYIDEAVGDGSGARSYERYDLKNLEAGKKLSDADPAQCRRYVLAAVEQVKHWDAETVRVRSQATSIHRKTYFYRLPGADAVWGRRHHALQVITALMRRKLPLTENDLLSLIEWCMADNGLSRHYYPVAGLTRAVEVFAQDNHASDELLEAIDRFATDIRGSYDKSVHKHATTLLQIAASRSSAAAVDRPPMKVKPVNPAPAGHPLVLYPLKAHLGMTLDPPPQSARRTEVDLFDLPAGSPYAAEHEIITRLYEDLQEAKQGWHVDLKAVAAFRLIEDPTPDEAARLVVASVERDVSRRMTDTGETSTYYISYFHCAIINHLAERAMRFTREQFTDYLLARSVRHGYGYDDSDAPQLVELTRHLFSDPPPSEGERFVLKRLRDALVAGLSLGAPTRQVSELAEMVGDGAMFWLVPGEAWSDAVNAELTAATPKQREAWTNLLRHAATASASRPSARWLKTAESLVKAVGRDRMARSLKRWLAEVPHGRSDTKIGNFEGDRTATDTMNDENAIVLRGLLWCTPFLNDDSLPRAIGATAVSAYKKLPGIGPRAVKVGNACIYALSAIGSEKAVAQLAMLKVRVKFGTAQKEIEKAFNVAAEKLGLPRDEIEEMAVPTYCLSEVGRAVEQFGDYTAEVIVDGIHASLRFADASGKVLKSVPAKVKAEHKEDLKELQQAAKDIAAMLPAQRDRLDSMFLLQKSWPFAVWRERYLDHPLIGTIARRLIWRMDIGGRKRASIWREGRLVDVDDQAVEPADHARVELWHPIDEPMDEVLAWRDWLNRHEIRQPFKQAHREVYLLTDAERRTKTYSNRFAAHILRQHQFNALCAARGWKNKLRLLVDDEYPPASRSLPQWGLRSEFWIEGIGDDYGTDTTESGSFLRIVTDQVRFYRLEAARSSAHASGGGYRSFANGPGEGSINAPLPLDQVPPLVLSEIMRDVDLFVGVASVGNDPTWQDGGPEGRYRDYWQSYSFGDLNATAQTRREVLKTLLPRLTKLKRRWELDEKFLIIQGQRRGYKIHLGSGNILMKPNDEYLCIVPDRSTTKSGDSIFLPFEGDATLSIILSKAFLLAEDDKITDPAILSQISQ